MKLYYAKGTCSLAVHIAIEALNIPCEFIAVNLSDKTLSDGSDYFKINPKGAVPCLQTDDGKFLTENIVIQIYLQDHFGKIKSHDFKYYEMLAAYNYVSTDLHKGVFSAFFNGQVSQSEKENVFKPLFYKKMDYVNSILKSNDYFCGDSFTIADAYLFTVLRWSVGLQLSLENYPSIVNYFNRILQEDCVQRALKSENLIVESMKIN